MNRTLRNVLVLCLAPALLAGMALISSVSAGKNPVPPRLPAECYQIVETAETLALTPQPALPPKVVTHNCNPQPEFQYEYCGFWMGEWAPLAVIPCPEGQTHDWECKTACFSTWSTNTQHATSVLRAALVACCETFNEVLEQMNADYASDIADAEAAFQACTKSPARCENDYCAAIAAAYAAYAATYAQAKADEAECMDDAFFQCELDTISQQTAYNNCMAGCCY